MSPKLKRRCRYLGRRAVACWRAKWRRRAVVATPFLVMAMAVYFSAEILAQGVGGIPASQYVTDKDMKIYIYQGIVGVIIAIWAPAVILVWRASAWKTEVMNELAESSHELHRAQDKLKENSGAVSVLQSSLSELRRDVAAIKGILLRSGGGTETQAILFWEQMLSRSGKDDDDR